MKDKINLGLWKVPELSESDMSDLLEGAKVRYKKKIRMKKIAYSASACILVCVIAFSSFYFSTRTSSGQMAELNRMLKNDVENNRDNKFFASGHGHEFSVREVPYDL